MGCGKEAQKETGVVGIIILLVDHKSFHTTAKRLEKQGLARALLSRCKPTPTIYNQVVDFSLRHTGLFTIERSVAFGHRAFLPLAELPTAYSIIWVRDLE